MQVRSALIIGLALAGAVTSGYFAFGGEMPGARKRVKPAQQARIVRAETVPNGSGPLEQAVQRARRTLAATAPLPGETVAANAADTRATASDTATTSAENDPGPTQEERMQYADAVFESEGFDRTFAHAQKDAIESRLHAVGIAGKVACRSSICRLEFSESVEETARLKVTELVRLGEWNTMVTHTKDASGATLVKVFLTGDGVLLPEPNLVATDP